MASKLERLTATGDVTTRRSYLKSVIVTGAVANTVDIRDGSTGAIVATLFLAASGQVDHTFGDAEGVGFTNGIHVTLSAAGQVSVEYDEIAG
jgi:hypothetical protein